MSVPLAVHQYGDHAVLLECDPADVAGWARTARQLLPAALDIVPGARTLVVDGVEPVSAMATLRDASPAPPESVPSDLVEIPATYDGADLAAVARLWECTEAEVVRRHRACEFTVAFCGFSPGFAYLTGLPAELAVPRLVTPRTRVPAGAIGLAGRFTGLYPTASPGGWQLIGHTDAALWSLERDPPALLVPGTVVRFVDA